MMRARTPALETISVTVPEDALEAYEAALASVCATVAFFRGAADGTWVVEGVRSVGKHDAALAATLAVAAALTGVQAKLTRVAVPADGWLARTRAAFPEQIIGRRFRIRGTHVTGPAPQGRVTVQLDAALAFGSGEHGSTRGCLLALERTARRQPGRILDLGTGSGILALAAARLLKRKVLAVDLDPWSVRAARRNATLNNLGPSVRVWRANGWKDHRVRAGGPYDLVLANILARPLCLMARPLAAHLAPGGTVILSGLLSGQARQVLAAHRRQALRLQAMVHVGPWTTLIMRRVAERPRHALERNSGRIRPSPELP
jgi:ribosomal protein L11 methyltransferase